MSTLPKLPMTLLQCLVAFQHLHRLVLVGVSLLVIGSLPAPSHAASPARPVIVFVHGGWGGGWQFKKVQILLEARGYEVWRPTLTGLGERAHLAAPSIGLDTHIEDIVNFLRFENLHEIVLVGHSYGGMVVTGVADRMPERIKQLIYLDAFVPDDGDSVASLVGATAKVSLEKMTKDGFIAPLWSKPNQPFPRDVPQPAKTLIDQISLKNPAAKKIPTSYILTVEKGLPAERDDFYSQSIRASERGWPVLRMEADHNPQSSVPEVTVDLITSIH